MIHEMGMVEDPLIDYYKHYQLNIVLIFLISPLQQLSSCGEELDHAEPQDLQERYSCNVLFPRGVGGMCPPQPQAPYRQNICHMPVLAFEMSTGL